MNIQAFDDLVDGVVTAPTLERRWSALTGTLAQMGIDQVNYALLDTQAAQRIDAPVRFLSTMRSEWIEHYSKERLDRDDPHVRLLRDGNLKPYVWRASDIATLEQKNEREVSYLAVDEGLKGHFQITLPDNGPSPEPIAGLLLGSSLPEQEFVAQIAPLRPLLVSLAYLFHYNAIGEIRRDASGAGRLSPRERDCLSYLANGLRIDGVAERLGLARVTVEMHLANARRKLRAATLYEAVARAVLWREI